MPKKRQQNGKEKTEFFFGYRIHTIVEVKTELLIVITVEQANHHDSKFFRTLFMHAKERLTFGFGANALQIQQWMLQG